MQLEIKSFKHAYIEMAVERYATDAEMIMMDVCCSGKASRRRVMSGEYERGDWNMNEFEKASDAIEKDRDYRVNNENVIEFLRGATTATVSFSQGRFISKIKKLAEKYPDEVEIVAENKDGSIVAHIPTHYIKISNMRTELSNEEREIRRERFINNVLSNNELEENDSKIDSNIKGDTL